MVITVHYDDSNDVRWTLIKRIANNSFCQITFPILLMYMADVFEGTVSVTKLTF